MIKYKDITFNHDHLLIGNGRTQERPQDNIQTDLRAGQDKWIYKFNCNSKEDKQRLRMLKFLKLRHFNRIERLA